MYTTSNNLENLELYLEHDSGYVGWELTPEDIEEARMPKLVFHSDSADAESAVLEGCSYISVDINYCLNLSPGQQKLYEILVSLQEGAVFTVTTVGKLAKAMGLDNPLAAGKRLEHLQVLGAISGFKP
ncbi:hypothetical protein [Halomicronema sp. CCY15110]|uniref:hypothetical protein n=1 Tax=Halomicronema sp. CCY15110 TaxID=2767773 RepID=UPI00194F62AB|nr:hypothetical protein [Halomicronema sp. CCY15110]